MGPGCTWGVRRGGHNPPGPPGVPKWVVPTSVASRTPSLHYKFLNIPKPLRVNLDQKFRRRRAPYPPKTNLDPFRHPAGGGNHIRWPSSSSRQPPRWGGSSPLSGLRVCTSSYVFNLSLSRVLEMSRSWCIAGFVNIVLSYGVFPSLSFCELSFPFEISLYRIEYFYGFENIWYLSCNWILVVTMGYRIDSLDICFGTQLADSRGDIGVIYA